MTGKPKAASCDRNNEGVKKTECEPLNNLILLQWVHVSQELRVLES